MKKNKLQLKELPEAFLQELKKSLQNEAEFASTCLGFAVERPITLRTNTLKINTRDLQKIFESNQIQTKIIGGEFLDCLQVVQKNRETRELTQLVEYENGLFYILNLSSVSAALALSPKPHEKVLDICAAPGGKTIILAQQMQNTGELIANDSSANRVAKLKNTLEIYGVKNTTTICRDARSLWQSYKEHFDRVLVDAPCSMEGRFQTNKPETFQGWSLKKVKSLAKLQRYILYSACSACAPGGTLVYSTCTLNTIENEKVIEWVLAKSKGTVICEKMERILPGALMSGFFLATLKKT